MVWCRRQIMYYTTDNLFDAYDPSKAEEPVNRSDADTGVVLPPDWSAAWGEPLHDCED